jgi:hypothetical protein
MTLLRGRLHTVCSGHNGVGLAGGYGPWRDADLCMAPGLAPQPGLVVAPQVRGRGVLKQALDRRCVCTNGLG